MMSSTLWSTVRNPGKFSLDSRTRKFYIIVNAIIIVILTHWNTDWCFYCLYIHAHILLLWLLIFLLDRFTAGLYLRNLIAGFFNYYLWYSIRMSTERSCLLFLYAFFSKWEFEVIYHVHCWSVYLLPEKKRLSSRVSVFCIFLNKQLDFWLDHTWLLVRLNMIIINK